MNNTPKEVYCQSCGIPMIREEDFGTTSRGGKKADYCYYCYRDGKFTDPMITSDGMIRKIAGYIASDLLIDENAARRIAQNFIPQLKRWQ